MCCKTAAGLADLCRFELSCVHKSPCHGDGKGMKSYVPTEFQTLKKEVGSTWRGDSPQHFCTPLIPVSLAPCTDLCNFEAELTSTTVKIVSAEPQEQWKWHKIIFPTHTWQRLVFNQHLARNLSRKEYDYINFTFKTNQIIIPLTISRRQLYDNISKYIQTW